MKDGQTKDAGYAILVHLELFQDDYFLLCLANVAKASYQRLLLTVLLWDLEKS
jgi:hypothetical protein